MKEQLTPAYALKPSKHQVTKSDLLLNKTDLAYLSQYSTENLLEAVGREHFNMFHNYLTSEQRVKRARLVNLLFSVGEDIAIADKSVIFQAVSLYDRYVCRSRLSEKDFQLESLLVGVTSLFIASKNQEVLPLSMADVKNHFLKKQYRTVTIIQKEKAIREACGYETEVSTLFDFVMLYIKTWKLKCQSRSPPGKRIYSSTYKFICDIEQITYDFTKALLVDVESL